MRAVISLPSSRIEPPLFLLSSWSCKRKLHFSRLIIRLIAFTILQTKSNSAHVLQISSLFWESRRMISWAISFLWMLHRLNFPGGNLRRTSAVLLKGKFICSRSWWNERKNIMTIIIRFLYVSSKQTNHANRILSKHWITPTKKDHQRKIILCVLYLNIEFARNQSNSVAFYDCGGQELLMPNFRFFLTFWVTTLNQSDLHSIPNPYTVIGYSNSPPLPLLLTPFWLNRSCALPRKAMFFMSCVKF